MLLASLQPCPATQWRVTAAHARPAASRKFLGTIRAPSPGTDELAWLRDHSESIMASLAEVGVLLFQDFEAPRTKAGFRSFCDTLPLEPCADPLASIGVRSLLSASDGVYEAVNAQALANTYIGLHNDATWQLTAPFAAFVCFQPAAEGGAFLVADGRRVLADLKPEVVSHLCERNISVRVAALDATPLLRLAGPLRKPLADFIAAVVRLVLTVAIPLGLFVAWADDGCTLQILERPKPPLNSHPTSGEPSFFSSLHSQSMHLQSIRSSATLGGVATTDVFYGDLQRISHAELEHIDEVITRHCRRIPMRPGEVVLLDSYQVLHGRESFRGVREHGVLWLTSPHDFPIPAQECPPGGEGFLSQAINWLAVKRRGD